MTTADVFTILEDPEPRDAANHIINGLASGKVGTIQGYCIVDYDGRAQSDDPAEGYFVTLLKPDGTTLVHSNEKYKPMNWQSSGAEITPRLTEDGDLRIAAESSDEYLEIIYKEVFSLTLLEAEPRSELDLVGTEEDMHARIMENPTLISDDFEALENEREFSFGRVDIFGRENENPVIVEVKRRSITRDHIYQLYTYLMEYEKEHDETAKGILVSPDCTEYMQDVMDEYDISFVEIQPLTR